MVCPASPQVLFDANTIGDVTDDLWCAACGNPTKRSVFLVVSPRTNPMFVVRRGQFTECDRCGCRTFTEA